MLRLDGLSMQENIRAVIDDLAFQRWAQLRRWITTHVATAIIEASQHDCAGLLMHQAFRVIEKYGAAAFTTNHKCSVGRLFIGQLAPPGKKSFAVGVYRQELKRIQNCCAQLTQRRQAKEPCLGVLFS